MIRHHRLLELFLHEKLGYAWDEVHEEADRLEHVISEDMERRIAEILGDPTCDPHGQPIPTRDLELLPTADCPLSELRPGQQAIVRRVGDEDASLLRYLARLGLRPHAHLKVIDYVPFDCNLRLQVAGQAETIVVGAQVADHIFVEALPER
jgi:DtxR family Mn-dependent transcriptional regulator